jgi:type III pantothenate kinase
MNLVLDIGNTRLKIGLFDTETLLESRVVADWSPWQALEYGRQNGVRRVMLSTVAEENPAWREILSENFDYQELTQHTPLPFENRYATPATLGKDRLAAIAGAYALMPGLNCLVVDCGTCIKYDLITAGGDYLGGNIAPGLMMRTKAMHHFTARLPEVEQRLPVFFIGDRTETALQNGAFRGALLEIEGFIALFARQFEALNVIFTGGDAGFVKPHFNHIHTKLEPDLTLFGLNSLLLYLYQRQP